uniref:Uncharacterized protein n=1 Tax=Parastrongyloides trichosuri TaxID=131310 RepID=A0A0N4Z3Y2_PARTI
MFYRFYRQQQREQQTAISNNPTSSINLNAVFGANSNIILPLESSNSGNYSKIYTQYYKRKSNPEIWENNSRGRRKISRHHSSFRFQNNLSDVDDMIFTQSIRGENYSPAVALFKTAGLIKSTAGINAAKTSIQTNQSGKKFFILFTFTTYIN